MGESDEAFIKRLAKGIGVPKEIIGHLEYDEDEHGITVTGDSTGLFPPLTTGSWIASTSSAKTGHTMPPPYTVKVDGIELFVAQHVEMTVDASGRGGTVNYVDVDFVSEAIETPKAADMDAIAADAEILMDAMEPSMMIAERFRDRLIGRGWNVDAAEVAALQMLNNMIDNTLYKRTVEEE